MRPSRAACLAASTGLLGLVAGVALAKAVYPPLEVLLKSGETTIGQPIAWPAGTPEVTAAIITLAPGASTGWHEHQVPLFGYILEGALTVDYGPDGARTYTAGDAFLEAYRSWHDGRTDGDIPVRLLAVYMGAEGVPNSVMRAAASQP